VKSGATAALGERARLREGPLGFEKPSCACGVAQNLTQTNQGGTLPWGAHCSSSLKSAKTSTENSANRDGAVNSCEPPSGANTVNTAPRQWPRTGSQQRSQCETIAEGPENTASPRCCRFATGHSPVALLPGCVHGDTSWTWRGSGVSTSRCLHECSGLKTHYCPFPAHSIAQLRVQIGGTAVETLRIVRQLLARSMSKGGTCGYFVVRPPAGECRLSPPALIG
jgi:hypothetical protein